MKAKKRAGVPLTLSIALSLNLAIAVGVATQATARESDNTGPGTLESQTIAQVTFDPPGDGEPADTAGGASRDDNPCLSAQSGSSLCVTPLVPAKIQGLTVAERPTFYVYVPPTEAGEIFFALKDENNRHHYQAKIPITASGGAIAITLPSDAPALEVGQTYRWTFVLLDEAGLKPDSPGVEGTIQRVAADRVALDPSAPEPSLELAQEYARAGIWYDTLKTLADLRQSQPEDTTLVTNWEGVLSSVGLEDIASKPLLQP